MTRPHLCAFDVWARPACNPKRVVTCRYVHGVSSNSRERSSKSVCKVTFRRDIFHGWCENKCLFSKVKRNKSILHVRYLAIRRLTKKKSQ